MGESIVKKAPPNRIGYPMPEFSKDAFDVQIWNYGYDSIVHTAIECPCRTVGGNSALSSCQNCGGMGWVFINPVQVKSIITSINRDTKLKPWSTELIGTVSVTFRDVDQVAFMDRITIMNEFTIFSENRPLKKVGDDYFCFLSYEAEEILDVFLFEAPDKKLIRVPNYNLKVGNRYILLVDSATFNMSTNKTISVRYRHKIQYNVLDVPHAIRSSNIINRGGRVEKVKLPNQVIARLAHYVLRPDFNNQGVYSNSVI